jgi:regulator of replication initiation timing
MAAATALPTQLTESLVMIMKLRSQIDNMQETIEEQRDEMQDMLADILRLRAENDQLKQSARADRAGPAQSKNLDDVVQGLRTDKEVLLENRSLKLKNAELTESYRKLIEAYQLLKRRK